MPEDLDEFIDRMLDAIEPDVGVTAHVALLRNDLSGALADLHAVAGELHELIRHPDIAADKRLRAAIVELDATAIASLAELDAAAARLADRLWERTAAESAPLSGRM